MIKNLRPRLSEQGKIKIGHLGELRKTRDGKGTYRQAQKDDHFIITSTVRDNSGNFVRNVPLMEKIAEVVNEPADHLTTIPVYLLFDDLESNFYTCYNCYQGKTRICTGDGKRATLLKTGEEIPCPCPKLDQAYKGPTPCKPYGRLSVVLQCMDIVGGAWIYRTTGWNSVQDILGSLLLIQRVAGRLSGIPLRLKLLPKTVQLPRGPATVYTVSVIYFGSPGALVSEAKRLPMIERKEDLAPDQTIDQEEESEIAEEFYPDPEAAVIPVKGKSEASKAKKKEPSAAGIAQASQKEEKKKEKNSPLPKEPAKEPKKSVSPEKSQGKEEKPQPQATVAPEPERAASQQDALAKEKTADFVGPTADFIGPEGEEISPNFGWV